MCAETIGHAWKLALSTSSACLPQAGHDARALATRDGTGDAAAGPVISSEAAHEGTHLDEKAIHIGACARGDLRRRLRVGKSATCTGGIRRERGAIGAEPGRGQSARCKHVSHD